MKTKIHKSLLALYKAEERSARLKKGPAGDRATSMVNRASELNQSRARASTIKTSNNRDTTATNNGDAATTTTHQRVGSTYKPISKRKKSTDRTTRLLIVILVLFLLTEFPQVRCLIKSA